MAHKNKESLTRQIEKNLTGKLAAGESRHNGKADGSAEQKIYSYTTLQEYMKHCCQFARYCKEKHGSRTLEDCRPYVDEYLQSRFCLSAYTVKLDAAAIAKLYGCSMDCFVKTPPRRRADIKRSRGESRFPEHLHQQIVEFCRSTGLRRRELSMLTGDRLVCQDGKYYLDVCKGAKGGKRRLAPVIGNIDNVVTLMRRAGSCLVWPDIPTKMDVHRYRAEYCTEIYRQYERTIETCLTEPFYNPETGRTEPTSLYCMRKDCAGIWLDKFSMLMASRALGHNRISVVAEHYIRIDIVK